MDDNKSKLLDLATGALTVIAIAGFVATLVPPPTSQSAPVSSMCLTLSASSLLRAAESLQGLGWHKDRLRNSPTIAREAVGRRQGRRRPQLAAQHATVSAAHCLIATCWPRPADCRRGGSAGISVEVPPGDNVEPGRSTSTTG